MIGVPGTRPARASRRPPSGPTVREERPVGELVRRLDDDGEPCESTVYASLVRRSAPALVLLASALAACGSSDGSSPGSPTTVAAPAPTVRDADVLTALDRYLGALSEKDGRAFCRALTPASRTAVVVINVRSRPGPPKVGASCESVQEHAFAINSRRARPWDPGLARYADWKLRRKGAKASVRDPTTDERYRLVRQDGAWRVRLPQLEDLTKRLAERDAAD